jgi:hypothetical protein
MASLRRRALPLVLLVAAGCGGPGPERVLSAAGTASPEPPTTTTSTLAPITTTTPAVTPTTLRRTTTTTTPARPATTRVPVTPAPPIAGYSPPPPPPGVVADGYGGYGGIATTSAEGAVVDLSLYPREQYFGEPVQVRVEVTTKDVVSIRIDMGNGTEVDGGGGGVCSTEPHTTGGGAPFYVYPAPGQYRIRAIVTVVPCFAIPGPPGSPPGAPSPFERHTVEASIGLNQRPDRPPRPVGPPPGA